VYITMIHLLFDCVSHYRVYELIDPLLLYKINLIYGSYVHTAAMLRSILTQRRMRHNETEQSVFVVKNDR